MRRHWIFGMTMLLAMGSLVPAASAGTFNSGSTGAQGAFPPTTPPAGTTGISLNLNTGLVTYIPSNTTATLPNVPPGGFQNGTLNFTTFTLATGITLTFVKNATNTPVTLLAQTDVTIDGTIDVQGQQGRPAVVGTSFDNAWGAGGPGGLGGGAGGNSVPVASGLGGQGLGPGGGGPGTPDPTYGCTGSGGGYATPGLRGYAGSTFCGTAGAIYGNPQLLPLLGGSGGAGGSVPYGRTGGGGGGGGGALLIAATGTIRLNSTGTITARGGRGGNGISGQSNDGGAGAGGAVRLVATTLTGSGGMIEVRGGTSYAGYAIGGNGWVRLEAYTNTLSATFPTNPPSGYPNYPNVIPSVSSPGAVALASGPTLRIASIAGINAPTNPTGSYGTPDITVSATTASPVAVVVTATNIPNGTPVVLRATPLTGSATTATTPGLSGGTASTNLAVDLTQPGVVSGEATFALAGWFDSPIKYAGEEVTTVQVAASWGGPSQARYFTARGREVSADAVAALGLPR